MRINVILSVIFNFDAGVGSDHFPLRLGVPGHRNSGGNGWSLFCEDVVCVTAVDTIRPNDAPEYRGWVVPLHEFGHAVEITLGLQATTRALRFQNNEPLDGAYYFETYAWAVQNWFSENPVSARAGFAPWEYNYLATVSSDLGKTDPWTIIESVQGIGQIQAEMPQARSKVFARLRIDIL